jgi:regulator of sigma E protease
MTTILNILLFAAILATLILVHEFGHFIVAKKSGIRVDEFGLGFPPKLWAKKWGETTYTLNLLPFGGFVKIFGEDPNDENTNGPDRSRSFVHKPRYIQAMVLIAGVTFNFLFAALLLSIGFMVGMPSSIDEGSAKYAKDQHILITKVGDNSPASKAGLKIGDTIVAIVADNTTLQDTSLTPVAIQQLVLSHADKRISLVYKRNGQTKTETLVPIRNAIAGYNDPAIGIAMDTVGTVVLPIHKAFFEGFTFAGSLFVQTIVGLYHLITGIFTGHSNLSQVTGPVGIVGLVGEASRMGFIYLVTFTSLISINLAVINLLPFPALDGGRLLFVIIEAIKRSPINAKYTNALNYGGFVILIGLMLLVTFHDVFKLLH